MTDATGPAPSGTGASGTGTSGTDATSSTRRSSMLTVGTLLAVVAYAVLATRWVNADPGWYDALPKPSWQPPDWVFGVAWPYNFVALAVAGVTVSRTATRGAAGLWLAVLVVEVVLALLWAYLFYVPHSLGAAAVALAGAAVLAWSLALLAWRVGWWTGLVVLPYAVWMTVATSLAVGFATGAGQGHP